MSDHSLVVLVNKLLLVLESIDTLCGSVIQSFGTASDSSYYVTSTRNRVRWQMVWWHGGSKFQADYVFSPLNIEYGVTLGFPLAKNTWFKTIYQHKYQNHWTSFYDRIWLRLRNSLTVLI
jgi:hypothetical protein